MKLNFYTDLTEWGFSLIVSKFDQEFGYKRNFDLWITFLCFSVDLTFLTIRLHNPNKEIEWPRE